LIVPSQAHSADTPSQRGRTAFHRTLYFRVLIGIAAGVLLGVFYPHAGAAMKPLGDGFIKLIRMLVAPIIFFTVVTGIAGVGDLRKLGRMGLKALIYFEVVSTLALVLGMIAAQVVGPGRGMNVNPGRLDAHSLAQYTAPSAQPGVVDFLLNIIPETFLGAFSKGEVLQVLLLAILSGVGLALLGSNDGAQHRLAALAESLQHFFFKLVAIVMEAVPVGAFGAMAFTVGKYGIATLLSLAKLVLCAYLTSIGFVVLVLGLICLACGISLWRFLVYIREEILIVLGTSSSEPALPRLMLKLENLGCSKVVVGLVVPAGYSFNLDGTAIYLTVATLFVAQATNTHLTLHQEIFILFVLMLNSKGAATVTGGGFITLTATLAAVGTVPVAGVALLLGVDRFLSEVRAVTNIIGNGVATIVIARWEGQFDMIRARAVLSGKQHASDPELVLREHAGAI
jgi:aerobic C4-dicarboxylate transport protein